jgi:hypothetical protein
MRKHLGLATAFAVGTMALASSASAQHHETVVTESGPNRALLNSGLFTFGVPYIASVVVAAESSHPGDDNLYLPVVGPWMDLAHRGDCGRLGEPSCDAETGYKILLVADGIFQGIGALDIVGAFVFPETRVVRIAKTERRLFIAPAPMGKSGYGIAARAAF